MPQSTCFGPMVGPDVGPAPEGGASGRGMRPGGPGSGRGGRGSHGGRGGHGMHGMHAEPVVMTVDQYEAIRLIDLEGFTQEACAEKMEIARTTVQSIYAEARKKLADALVNGKMLRIEGGEYKLCESSDQPCGHEGCHHRRHF